MITTTDNPIVVQSNLTPIASRVMSVDVEALASITDSMVNLYSDKHGAVIREYATNARDGMRAAGKFGPVTITLPDQYDQQLVIIDTGIGMTMDQVLNRFSQYGTSDKRNTNTQVGSFGYGCKVGFAISDQFSVTSVHDGMKTVALFSRNADRVGTADIIAHVATDEPSGTRVSVPVAAVSQMRESVKRFLWGWDPSEYLIEDADSDENVKYRSMFTEGIQYGPVLYTTVDWRESTYGRKDSHEIFVRMGGVLYPLANQLRQVTGWEKVNSGPKGIYIIEAEVGSVDIVPSREGLRDSIKTADFLRAKYAEYVTHLTETIHVELAEQPTLLEAAKYLYQRQDLMSAHSIKVAPYWRVMRVTEKVRIALPGFQYDSSKDRFVEYPEGQELLLGVNRRYPSQPRQLAAPISILVITDLPEGTPVSKVKYRLKAYCEDHHGYARVLIAPDANFQFGWFDRDFPGVTVMTYADYDLARRPEKRTETVPVVYDAFAIALYSGEKMRTPISLKHLRGVTELYYTVERPGNQGFINLDTVNDFVGAFARGTVVVMLDKRKSEEAMIKRLPHIRPLSDLVGKSVDRQIKAFGAAQRKHLRAALIRSRQGYDERNVARALTPHVSRLTSPAVREMIKLGLDHQKTPEEHAAHMAYVHIKQSAQVAVSTPIRDAFVQEFEAVEGVSALIDNFPLLKDIARHGDLTRSALIEHAIAYLNATSPILINAASDAA